MELSVSYTDGTTATRGYNTSASDLFDEFDTIDHGSFLDEESIELFKETGAYLVPTLMPGHILPAQMEGNPFFTDAIKEKAYAAAAASKS